NTRMPMMADTGISQGDASQRTWRVTAIAQARATPRVSLNMDAPRSRQMAAPIIAVHTPCPKAARTIREDRRRDRNAQSQATAHAGPTAHGVLRQCTLRRAPQGGRRARGARGRLERGRVRATTTTPL